MASAGLDFVTASAAVELVMVVFFFLYILHSAKEVKAVKAIREAMTEWSSKTCIRFKKRTNETAYVRFKLGSG